MKRKISCFSQKKKKKTKKSVNKEIETFRRVSDIATATHDGHTDRAIRFKNPTSGAEQIATVTPATVRICPCLI